MITNTRRGGIVFAIALLALFPICSSAQTLSLSGIVNVYTHVAGIYGNGVSVSSDAGFAAGDRVLLIQMQGAIIDSSNTAKFGSIINYNHTGNFEFATVASVQKDFITLDTILHAFDASQHVQLIRVPHATSAVLNGLVTAPAWNGSTGGVVAIEVCGSLDFKNNISVSGLGFRGGAPDSPSIGDRNCYTDYYVGTGSGAAKGEGIASAFTQNHFQFGRGAMTNGGGGGNAEEGGGGGGSNFNLGGSGGGNSGTSNCGSLAAGLSGINLLYANTSNLVFLGGGGGAGHNDDNENHPPLQPLGHGANGGGLVLLRADTILGNKFSILANGSNGTDASEGSGGGGAGGTVLLDALTFDSQLNIQAKGGNGGSSDNLENSFFVRECSGSGGGGAGGVVWVSTPTLNANVSVASSGGAGGTSTNCASSDGQKGQGGSVITGLVIPPSPCVTGGICVSAFPPSVTASNHVVVNATLNNILNGPMDSLTFDINYQPDALAFTTMTSTYCTIATRIITPGTVRVSLQTCTLPLQPGLVCSAVFMALVTKSDTTVTLMNIANIQAYPASPIQLIGCTDTVTILPLCGMNGAVYTGTTSMSQNYPNPFSGSTSVTVSLAAADVGHAQLKMYNLLGEQVADFSKNISGASSVVEFNENNLPAGLYFYRLIVGDRVITKQLAIAR